MAWPASTPLPDQVSVTPYDPNVYTDMEGGLARVRGRTVGLISTMVNQQWTMSGTELADFRTFCNTTNNASRDWFSATIWDGSTYTTKTVRVRQWRWAYKDYDQHTVQAVLEVEGGL